MFSITFGEMLMMIGLAIQVAELIVDVAELVRKYKEARKKG